MKKNVWRRTSMLLIVVTMPVALAAAPATAAAPETPNGFVGACNMLNAMNVGANGDRGMGWAMVQNTRNGTNGNDGMWRAVDRSGCT
ncbi:MAG: hypothetical protein HHJ11_15680 [Phycicoccus sp.]|nr:hypothetical protein [Phycicoccus sp.]NMM32774.1 hypothetical protein [Phycicoccus sp.]